MINQRDTFETIIRFKFYKIEEFKYLSHLDITRIIIRALRRAELKIRYSLGYNPKPKIIFSLPTPLGIESLAEYSDVVLDEKISGQEFKKRVNLQLKPQIRIIKSKNAAAKKANLMNDIAAVLYNFRLEHLHYPKDSARNFYKEMEKHLKTKSDFSNSIFDLKIIKDKAASHFFCLKIFGYAKIFNGENNEFFKFNDFYKYFASWLENYDIGVKDVKKEELFVLRGNVLKTPMEAV